MGFKYIDSDKIRVFPCANRGTKDYESKLLTEYTLSHLPSLIGSDDFVIGQSGGTPAYPLRFVLGGYYFEISSGGIVRTEESGDDGALPKNLIVAIGTVSRNLLSDDATGVSTTILGSLKSDGTVTELTDLDSDSDNPDKFTGLMYSTDGDTISDDSVKKLVIIEDGELTNTGAITNDDIADATIGSTKIANTVYDIIGDPTGTPLTEDSAYGPTANGPTGNDVDYNEEYTIPYFKVTKEGLLKEADDFTFHTTLPAAGYCVSAHNAATKVIQHRGYKKTQGYELITFPATNNYSTGVTKLKINDAEEGDLYIDEKISGEENYNFGAGTYLVYCDGTDYWLYTDGQIKTSTLYANAIDGNPSVSAGAISASTITATGTISATGAISSTTSITAPTGEFKDLNVTGAITGPTGISATSLHADYISASGIAATGTVTGANFSISGTGTYTGKLQKSFNIGVNGNNYSFNNSSTTGPSGPSGIYAPTGPGATGQWLKSTNGTPKWADVSSMTAGAADKLSSEKTISLTGDVTGSVSTDFSSGPSITTTIGTSAVETSMIADDAVTKAKLGTDLISTAADTANGMTVTLGQANDQGLTISLTGDQVQYAEYVGTSTAGAALPSGYKTAPTGVDGIAVIKQFDTTDDYNTWKAGSDYDSAVLALTPIGDSISSSVTNGTYTVTLGGKSVTASTASSTGPTASWNLPVKVGTVNGVDLTFTMPTNPNSDTKNTVGATTSSTAILYWIGATGTASSTSQQSYKRTNVYTTSAGQLTAVSFNASSDERLKKDITDYEYHDSILDIPVKEYTYKDSGLRTIGFIAQDLQKDYPEMVDENDEGYLSIKSDRLFYLLLEETKKLRDEISALKAEITALKGE